jgi:hypothetical protein
MSTSMKSLVVVAAISVGAIITQFLSAQDCDQPNSSPAEANGTGTNFAVPENLRGRARPRADDLPLQHAILKKEDEQPEEKIAAALDKATIVDFQDLALEEALTFLGEYHGVNIWLDKQSLTDEGVSLDQPVTLKLAGVRLESILNLLLQPLQLDWVVQDEVLKITTSAWAYDHPEIQTYDVQNLLEAGHTPEELIAAITKCVEPGTWTGKDATGGISHTGGVLVVRHTQRAHSDVARLVADLEGMAESNDDNRREQAKNAVVSIKVYRTLEQPAEKIALALQDFVEFSSWKNGGGEGEIRALKGAVVVKQTRDVHRLIQRFLAQLEPELSTAEEKSEALSPSGQVTRTSQDPFGVLNPAAVPHGNHAGSGRMKSGIKRDADAARQ